MIDELGALEKELAPLAGKIARIECLRRNIRAQVPDSVAAHASYELAGERFVACIGPKGFQTSINAFALVKRIGVAAYAKIATVTLRALEQHYPGDVAYVTGKERTGPRSLTVMERGGHAGQDLSPDKMTGRKGQRS